MKTTNKPSVDIALREEWLRTVNLLEEQINTWIAQEPGWTVAMSETELIREDLLGDYTAPMQTIHTSEGEVRVEPIARNFPGSGIVEMYAWPTLRRVRLIHDQVRDGWQVLTDSGIYLRQEWNSQSFITLANDLIQAK